MNYIEIQRDIHFSVGCAPDLTRGPLNTGALSENGCNNFHTPYMLKFSHVLAPFYLHELLLISFPFLVLEGNYTCNNHKWI